MKVKRVRWKIVVSGSHNTEYVTDKPETLSSALRVTGVILESNDYWHSRDEHYTIEISEVKSGDEIIL